MEKKTPPSPYCKKKGEAICNEELVKFFLDEKQELHLLNNLKHFFVSAAFSEIYMTIFLWGSN